MVLGQSKRLLCRMWHAKQPDIVKVLPSFCPFTWRLACLAWATSEGLLVKRRLATGC